MIIGRGMHVPRDRKLRGEVVAWLDERSCPATPRTGNEDYEYLGTHFDYHITQSSMGWHDQRLTFMINIWDEIAHMEFKLAWADRLMVEEPLF